MSGNDDKATPRPWHASNRGVGWEVHGGEKPADGCWTGKGPDCPNLNDGFRDTMEQPDAELIVRAVNSHDALRNVVEALILFYDSPHWTPEKAARWEELTGATEATTKVLADSARVALGMVVNR